MQVWTIQRSNVLDALRTGRIWRADAAHVREPWQAAYRWMTRAMVGRLGPPAARHQMPIWCWYQWRGQYRRKPDLRYRGHLPRGTRAVRLELRVTEERVLRSDFDLWHYVLNGWYLPASADDEHVFDSHPDRRRIRPSWQRIFDLQWNDVRYTLPPAERSIQGVIWDLMPEDVVQSQAFIAR